MSRPPPRLPVHPSDPADAALLLPPGAAPAPAPAPTAAAAAAAGAGIGISVGVSAMADTQRAPIFPPPSSSSFFARQFAPHRRPSSPIRLPPLTIPPVAFRPELQLLPPVTQPPQPFQADSRRPSQSWAYPPSAAPLEKLLLSNPYTPPRSSDPPQSPQNRPPTRAQTDYIPLVSPRSEADPRPPSRLPADKSPPAGSRTKRSNPPFAGGFEPFQKHAVPLPSPSRSSSYASGYAHHRHSGSSQQSDNSLTTSSHTDSGPVGHKAEAASFAQTARHEKSPLNYELRIRQQPIAARACGFGERDRRVIDPPPILELMVTDSRTGELDTEELRYSLNVVHCTLWNAEGTNEETALIQPDRGTTRRLMGQLVSSPAVAKDEYDVEGCFFCFPDLSCRTHGRYRLRFVLMRIDPMNLHVGGFSPIITDVLSEVFTVYTAKDFPGMRPSSALTRALKLQGCNIQVKKGNEKALSRKRDVSSDNEEDDEGERESAKLKRRKN